MKQGSNMFVAVILFIYLYLLLFIMNIVLEARNKISKPKSFNFHLEWLFMTIRSVAYLIFIDAHFCNLKIQGEFLLLYAPI
jgi:hypothetical protein